MRRTGGEGRGREGRSRGEAMEEKKLEHQCTFLLSSFENSLFLPTLDAERCKATDLMFVLFKNIIKQYKKYFSFRTFQS